MGAAPYLSHLILASAVDLSLIPAVLCADRQACVASYSPPVACFDNLDAFFENLASVLGTEPF